MSPQQSVYRIAWIGPEVGAGDYVLERFTDGCERLGIQPQVDRTAFFDLERVGSCDRIVLTSDNRACYPDREVQALMTSGQIVPWGVVTGSWHLGSRRSGQGVVTHWQQPWFRWWESWSGWFFPEAARPGSVVANGFAPVVTPLDYATPTDHTVLSATGHRLAILSACRQTTDLLTRQAKHAGWSANTYASWDECLTAVRTNTCEQPELLVWDDSLLPCLPGIDLMEAVENLSAYIERLDSSIKLIASIGFENIHLWTELSKRGCSDLLVKPGSALGLSNYLFHQVHASAAGGMTAGASDR